MSTIKSLLFLIQVIKEIEVQFNQFNSNYIFRLRQDKFPVEANLENFGRLYNGHSVIDERGVCPYGWHIPSEIEVSILFDYVGEPLGEQLRSSPSDSPPWSGSNESGFSLLPGGYRDPYWGLFGNSAGSSTEVWVDYWYEINLSLHVIELNSAQNPNVYNRELNNGASIRCIKD